MTQEHFMAYMEFCATTPTANRTEMDMKTELGIQLSEMLEKPNDEELGGGDA